MSLTGGAAFSVSIAAVNDSGPRHAALVALLTIPALSLSLPLTLASSLALSLPLTLTSAPLLLLPHDGVTRLVTVSLLLKLVLLLHLPGIPLA